MTGPDLGYLAASRRWRQDHGFEDGALDQRRIDDLPVGNGERWRTVCRRALSGTVESSEGELVPASGGARWLAWEVRPWRQADGAVGGIMAATQDITERKRFEAAQAHLAAIVASSSDAILSTGLDGTVTSWNAGAERMFGYRAEAMLGAPVRRLVPADRQHEEDMILARLATAGHIAPYETVRLGKEGRPIPVSVTVSALRDAAGRIAGASTIIRDISERRRQDERAHLLMKEVNHRAKNMLGIVRAIARQTMANSPQDFVARFEARVAALSANQDLLVRNEWIGVELHDLVGSQLAAFGDLIGRRITVDGPRLRLLPAAAQAIGMALHELATNAVKYGALSTRSGRVKITWSVEATAGGSRELRVGWTEQGGPPVLEPGRIGFGTTVTTTMARMSLGGSADVVYEADGLDWHLACPIENALEDCSHGESAQAPHSPRGG